MMCLFNCAIGLRSWVGAQRGLPEPQSTCCACSPTEHVIPASLEGRTERTTELHRHLEFTPCSLVQLWHLRAAESALAL